MKVDLDSSGLSFFAVKTKAMEGQFVSLVSIFSHVPIAIELHTNALA